MSDAMYVHVPFCNAICAYCDFTRCKYNERLADKWLAMMKQELDKIPQTNLETLYIGGGTPSALSPTQLRSLLEELHPFTKEIEEYTIEANADSLSDEKIEIMKHFHINRISLGAQSFQPELLTIIERNAGYEMIENRIKKLIKEGIVNISIDLMYGLPNQTLAMWKEDLKRAVSLPISHISLYSLTIEEHSKFGRMSIQPCAEELESDMFEYAISFLEVHGFAHYETSNFAKEGAASMHNQVYWQYRDFYGVGCGASGKINHQRYDNTKNIQTYITSGPTPVYTMLSKEEEMFEMLMMNLRMRKGIDEEAFFNRFQVSLWDTYKQSIEKSIKQGNLCKEHGYLKTTYHGMMILNEVLLDFL